MGGSERDVRTAPHPAAGSRWVPLFDVDPELARGVPDGELARARRMVVARLQVLPSGSWAALEEAERDPSVLAYYGIDGVISREVPVAGRVVPQLEAIGDAAVGVLGAEFARAEELATAEDHSAVAVTVLGHRVGHGRTA